MSHSSDNKLPKPIQFLFENSLFLIGGALVALVWANISPATYEYFVRYDLRQLVGVELEHHAEDAHPEAAVSPEEVHADQEPSDQEHADQQPSDHASADHSAATHFDIHFLVNDLFMALFFAIAAMEVWEAILPGGPLSNPRKAMTPLMATLGGIVGPASLYLLGVAMFASEGTSAGLLGRGWAIPCATDIAFSYLIARWIFGPGHPAIAFLLLLAIADDAAGLAIIAVAYPRKAIVLPWLLVSVGGMLLSLVFRRMKLHSFWWYLLIPGTISWIAFYMAGIHPSLGLVPIIPCMPHAHTDLGIFAREEEGRKDTLNEFAAWWKNPVELILGLFGLVNAGVVMGSAGLGTWLVLAGLIVGKPLGITGFTWIAEKVFRLEVPAGISYRHVLVLGAIAGIGFTVALFVADAAYPSNLEGLSPEMKDAVKLGALGSFGAAVVSFLLAMLLGVKPLKKDPS